MLDGKMMETEEMIIVPQLQSNKKYKKKKKYQCSRYMKSEQILHAWRQEVVYRSCYFENK